MSSLFDDEDQSDFPPCDSTGFMELLGSLLVHVVKTHADIAVRCMAMRAKESTLKYMQALFRMLAYLYSTGLPDNFENDNMLLLLLFCWCCWCCYFCCHFIDVAAIVVTFIAAAVVH
jgi:hypothetical protein